jgi:hypothetical protein
MSDTNSSQEIKLISNTTDFFLQSLVKFANQFNFGLSITISSGGLLISGQLISGDEYFSLLGQQILESPNIEEDSAKSLQQLMNMFGDFYVDLREKSNQKSSEESTDNNSEENEPPTSFFHLKNVNFFSPAGPSMNINSSFRLWRGNIDHIDGYTLGALEPSNLT